MLAKLHGLQCNRAVHVIGDGDVHRIDVSALLSEQLAPVLIDADLGESLLQRLHAAEVDIGHGDELECRMLREGIQVGERLTRRADAGVTEGGAARARGD